jgi:hypothetical protein
LKTSISKKGVKPLILGVVLVLLALLNIGFSVVADSAIDPFYLLLIIFGVSLASLGALRGKMQI